MYSFEEMRDFAARAATIDERLSGDYAPIADPLGETGAAARRLSAWRRAASGDDRELFAKRLQRDGLTEESVLARLGAVQLDVGRPLPWWTEDACWISAAMVEESPSSAIEGLRNTGDPQPFEDLFFGLLPAAEKRRDATLPSGALDRIDDQVLRSIKQGLLSDVTHLCRMPLYEEFTSYCERWRKEEGLTDDAGPRRHYDRFIQEMRFSGLRKLFTAKPVLLRLLASIVRQWIDTSSEFLCRLNADVDTIRRELLGRETASRVVSLSSGLSDPHNFGRSVYVLRFADGDAVVYKPKDLSVDASWSNLVEWLNFRNPPIDLRAARVVPRAEGYGWCEFIEHGDCDDRPSAQRFFRRAGALLCLSYIMAGSDMHDENVIAAGEHPIAIDLEMMLQSFDPGAATCAPEMQALEIAQRKLTESVLTTGLLPGFITTPDTSVMAAGGLYDGRTGRTREIGWIGINTDAMAPTPAPLRPRDFGNLPKLDGAKAKLADFVDEFQETCAAYFRFMASQKAGLLAADGPIARFAGNPIRHVLKPTRFYFLLLARARNHRDMGDGALWSAQLDFVSRLANWDKEAETSWPLFAAERRALADLNIPFFVGGADSDGLSDGANSETASGLEAGLSIARRRIAQLDDEAIGWQLDVLRLTTSRNVLPDSTTSAVGSDLPRASPRDTRPLVRDTGLAWAGRIADRIAARALRDGPSAAWIGLDPLADGGGWSLKVLGDDLYGGAPGVALFLAANAHLNGRGDSADLSRAALSSLRYAIRGTGAARFARLIGIGGAGGMGSVVYSLASIAAMLDDKALLSDARIAACLMTDEVISGDKNFDVTSGAAGGILGLLKLHRQTGDLQALDRAVACGRHLLRSRMKDGGLWLWRHQTKRTLTGMSHGVSGIGYALASLAKATGREEFVPAALDCLAYERSLFSVGRGNWPDLRQDDHEPSWPSQWCHGAAGVGLARIGLARFGGLDTEIKSEIEIAVGTARRLWPSPNDTLCCGNLGNIEFLSEAGRTLRREELTALASSRLAGILDLADNSGVFGWTAGDDDENIGFFRGLSGVGYTVLRLIAPETLPDVLIWE